MKDIEFNKVPPWCPYTPNDILSIFHFDLKTAKGIVNFNCVHCGKFKEENVNSIRLRIRRGLFTSLCSKCRGTIQRKIPSKISIIGVPIWMNKWLSENDHTLQHIEDTINSGQIVDVKQGGLLNRGIKFHCIRCKRAMTTTVSRIKTSSSNNQYTGLCRGCVSSVRHNVCETNPRVSSNGYILIQKSMVPEKHHHLCNWTAPVMEHRYKMAVHLNRPLSKNEIVHHIDGNKQNNRIENLELWNTSHPCGQRVSDKLEWANRIISQYKKEKI